eukprot:1454030-Ditylum_brightwellii.AAC.1
MEKQVLNGKPEKRVPSMKNHQKRNESEEASVLHVSGGDKQENILVSMERAKKLMNEATDERIYKTKNKLRIEPKIKLEGASMCKEKHEKQEKHPEQKNSAEEKFFSMMNCDKAKDCMKGTIRTIKVLIMAWILIKWCCKIAANIGKQGSLPSKCKSEDWKKSSVKKMPTICHFKKQECTAGRTTEASNEPKIRCRRSILDEEIEPTTVAVPRKPRTAGGEETTEPKTIKVLLAWNIQVTKHSEKQGSLPKKTEKSNEQAA